MKLHLGCGEKYIEGFVHIDMLEYEHIDHKSSLEELNFIESNSVEYIYASHVLEHFSRDSIEQVLSEWLRVLQPCGVLRVAVPDFQAITSRYQMTGNLEELLGLLIGGQKDKYDWHGMVFDFNLLCSYLKKVGFKHVTRYDWRLTEHADLDDYSQAYLPHMDKETGQLMSLNVEAIK